MQKLIRILKSIFRPELLLRPLLLDIQEDKKRISELIAELKIVKQWNFEYVSILDGVTESMKAMVWSKDKDHKYILANAIHCNSFFGFDTSNVCLEEIKGRSDQELLETYFESHPFSNICSISDDFVKNRGTICHFMEAAVVNNEQLLLYIIKIPIIENGEFKGTNGIAWDMSSLSEFLIKTLNSWIHEGKATLVVKEDQLFSYVVEPEQKKCDIFSHICPHPHYEGEDCSNINCSVPHCGKRKK